MIRYYIKSIGVTGPNVRYSSISFDPGVNIVHGPSNTGKSYIMACINFVFGGDIPFERDSNGYDTVTMRLETDGEHYVELTRTIVEGKNGDTGSGKVSVFTNLDWIDTNEFKIANGEYNSFLLRLLGINEPHNIISTQDFDTNNLTFRTLLHFFYLDEDNIIQKESALDISKHSKVTACLSSLIFLLSGNDMNTLIPEETKEDREQRLAQKAGVIQYLRQKLESMKEKQSKLELSLTEFQDIDEMVFINKLSESVGETERQIIEASAESQALLKQIYDLSAKMEEAQFLHERYKALHTQYDSDIKRLHLISDGLLKTSTIECRSNCPICGKEVTDLKKIHLDKNAVSAELQRVEGLLCDLGLTEADVDEQIIVLQTQLDSLNERNDSITKLIEQELRPHASEMKESLNSLIAITRMRQSLAELRQQAADIDLDIKLREVEEETDDFKFDAKKMFSSSIWDKYSDIFNEAVAKCAYPGYLTAHMNISTLDAVVNGKQKRNEGKGFRAFLNTLVLFSLMKLLESEAKYRPALLILDSPILSLKERKLKLSENEKATPGMKISLFEYIIKNRGENQIIIFENEIPEEVDYSSVNLIEFTMSESDGRYGFLIDVKNTEGA